MNDDRPKTNKRNFISSISQSALFPTFGDNFLVNHAGRIMSEPKIAIIELVANCWDAGADKVEILWPLKRETTLSVRDNGTGMTRGEFIIRWNELNYNRLLYQGVDVEFPVTSRRRNRKRVSFGRNGIGRHAMFCFSDQYYVDTIKDGYLTRVHVQKSSGNYPFTLKIDEEVPADGHGTTIYTKAYRGAFEMDAKVVRDLIGAQFVADPEFNIYVNGEAVTLTDLERVSESTELNLQGLGSVKVSRFDSEMTGKTSKQHGVAWWVNRRLVGVPSWDGYDEPLVDARTTWAKRYTYVVEADMLSADVRSDWTGFYASEASNYVRKTVYDYIKQNLRDLSYDDRRERKRAALAANRNAIKELPIIAQEQVASFAEELQLQCPTLTEKDLDNAVRVLANLEKARSGYQLLETLSNLDPNDIDALTDILEKWSVSDAKKVLEELHFRLDLITKLEALVESPEADELHDLQPLFERGLWIFGPEFEAISFTSNRALKTVVDKFFGGAVLKTPSKRPDFVILPDTSIGVYSSDAFDSEHNISGIDSVIIVELKRGGFNITDDEKDQAVKYSREIRRSGRVGKGTKIVCYVLGTTVDPSVIESQEGATYVYPRTYERVLKQAHARTFHLLRKIEAVKQFKFSDEDLREVVHAGQVSLFDEE